MTNPPSSAPPSQSPRLSVVVAIAIGNTLEWFDFIAYGFFAVTMARLFFPAESEAVSLLLTFGTFGVTFFMRPLGAIIIGSFADRHGRKAGLVLTIMLMTAGTAMIAVAPTYASIGILAPALIIVARMAQGFSAGGEFGSATAFLAEQNPQRRGLYASVQFASQGLTAVLATGFGAVLSSALSSEQLHAWGWRIPFIFGILLGPVAYYIRRRLNDTPEFRSIEPSKAPLREIASDGGRRLLTAIGVVVCPAVVAYTIIYMPTYAAQHLGLPQSQGFLAGVLTGAIQLVVAPCAGALSDRYGRMPVAFIPAVIILLATYPMFVWLAAVPTLATLMIVQATIGALLAVYAGALPALMSELFPTRIRTTGLSISYSIGVAIFGGLAPLFNAWLIESTGSKISPSFYLVLAAVTSLAALHVARRSGIR